LPEKLLIGGEWRSGNDVLEVNFPYDGTTAGAVYLASETDIEDAIVSAQRGFEVTRRLASHKRTEILLNLHRLMSERFDDLVELMIMEGGKTRQIAIGETTRAMQTILVSSEEARRIEGEVFSIDWTPGAEHKQGFTRRMPIGTVLAITPFNYPLNLACHKIGPAIAAGNALILKPAEKTPLSSVLLAELILEAGFPPEAFSMLNCYGPQAEAMVTDDRIAMLSFTGSSSIGWMLKSKAGMKRVALELGGNAGVIVHQDADMVQAVSQVVTGGFANAGQNCISVQRILVQEDRYMEFTDAVIRGVRALKIGDPREAHTDLGPMISEREAQRAESWVNEAIEQGASLLVGGGRDGAIFPPTMLANTNPQMRVSCEEAFAPIVTVVPYKEWDDAVSIINDTPYGLQAGLFTNDMNLIMDAWDRIDVGGLQVNSVPTFRVDHMPYGGIKASGFGREGVKYTIEEMTELRLMVIHRK
jgi:acyl-CoA reductase-like NAD-dependent aldehyde dehydrogenase